MWPVPCGSHATSRTALKTCLMWKILSRGAKWDNLPSELRFYGNFGIYYDSLKKINTLVCSIK